MVITTLSQSEVREFVHEALAKIQYKLVSHSWYKPRHLSKNVCRGCGLVALNNALTDWSIGKGCLSEYHPGYKAARKRYAK